VGPTLTCVACCYVIENHRQNQRGTKKIVRGRSPKPNFVVDFLFLRKRPKKWAAAGGELAAAEASRGGAARFLGY
jgi:hypothetical protein